MEKTEGGRREREVMAAGEKERRRGVSGIMNEDDTKTLFIIPSTSRRELK